MAKAQPKFDPSKLDAMRDLFAGDDEHYAAHQALASASKLSESLQHWLRELAEQILVCRRQIHQLTRAGKGDSEEAAAIHHMLDELVAKQTEAKRELAETEAFLAAEARLQAMASIESQAREQQALREKNLLPIRHKNRDFFLADLLDYAMKDDGVSMEAPIFTLATKPDLSIWEWTSKDQNKQIRVTPSVLGRATQFDKDVLIYVISQLTAALNENEKATRKGKPEPRPDARNRVIRFRVYDYLVTTNKGVGKADYTRLNEAFERLRGTTITTNIRTGGQLTKETFGIIERAKIVVDSERDDRMQAVEVTISEWLYNAVQAFEVLTIHKDYFRLRKPLERRLYELARKHCGSQEQWCIGLAGLKDKAGSKSTLREFRRMVKEIAKTSTLPEYGLMVGEDDQVMFFKLARPALQA